MVSKVDLGVGDDGRRSRTHIGWNRSASFGAKPSKGRQIQQPPFRRPVLIPIQGTSTRAFEVQTHVGSTGNSLCRRPSRREPP